MTRDEVFEEVAKIISGYTVFQCVDCAAVIKAWLKANGIHGVHLQMTAIGRLKFIVSQRWQAGRDCIA